MHHDTPGDPSLRRRGVRLLMSLSAGVLVSVAFGIVGSRRHSPPPFSDLHLLIIQRLESPIGVILITVMFISVLVIRFEHKNAWQYAFLAGVGIGNLLFRIVSRLV